MSCNYICPTPIAQEIESIPDTGYAPFYFSEEGDTLLFGFTSTSFTRVLSALMNGAQLTYGADGFQVVWDFLVNVEYPIIMPDECEAIIACIEDDEATQHAIEHMLEHNTEFQDFLSEWIADHPNGTQGGKNKPIDPTIPLTITQPDGDCDLDKLWAQCIGLVETANEMIVDFIEKWELYTNKGEVVSDMVNAVPLLSELAQASGISGVLEYANDLVDAIGENYTGDYDLAYKNALACELFCAAQLNNCRVTSEMAQTILNTRIGNALNISNTLELIVSLTDQDITGFNVADLYMAFFFNAIAIGNLVIPVTWGLDTFVVVMMTFDEGSNDWEELCTDCPEVTPRYPLHSLPAFDGQIGAFIGYGTGENSDYDVWAFTPFYNGSDLHDGYQYGVSIYLAPNESGPAYSAYPFSIVNISAMEEGYSYRDPGVFANEVNFEGDVGAAYWAVGMFRSSSTPITFMIKPRV